MLSEEKNRLLTEVAPGRPMGDLLRRYWHPIAGVSEFDDLSVKDIRLFGEDLILYKDLSGKFGLVQRRCPHRNADLLYGLVEKCGIRCSYHGWQFDESGQCVHQPFEEIVDPKARMRKNTKITAYRVEQKAGMLWTYMGPAPAPLLPDWDVFNFKNGFVQVAFAVVPCNWLQCQENSIDPVHFEWTHNNLTARLQGRTRTYAPVHLKIEFEQFEYGLIYKRLREGDSDTNPMWQVGRVALWPNAFYLGHQFEWRVPIDNENTLSVLWVFSRVPKEQEPYVQGQIPSWYGPLKDPQTGRWITTHVINQDFAAWVGQGRIADRQHEHLGASDRGVVLMRRLYLEQLDAIAAGEEPMGLIRDPETNHDVVLPSACRDEMLNGMPRSEQAKHPLLGPYLRDFIGQAGQPAHIRRDYETAIGQKTEGATYFAVHGAGQSAAPTPNGEA